jgi:hypothetical protein
MATIKDVAELAGVSFKTVSCVINRNPYVRDEVRQKVLRAADVLEYRPHLHARHMRTQRSKVFAFISDDVATTPFAGQIIQGAQVTAWQYEMLLLMFNPKSEVRFSWLKNETIRSNITSTASLGYVSNVQLRRSWEEPQKYCARFPWISAVQLRNLGLKQGCVRRTMTQCGVELCPPRTYSRDLYLVCSCRTVTE